MGIFSRLHRIPPFFVGTLCGGSLYVYFHQNLRLRYHTMPQSIWDIIYAENKGTSASDGILSTEIRIGRTQNELYDAAAQKRANWQYYKNCMIIGYNDTIRSTHAFLIKQIFGEELG